MLAQKDGYIKSAYGQLQLASQDREKRLEYEARQKAIWDYNQSMKEARESGEERGREEGRQEASKQINKLIALLMNDNRFEDLKRSASDEDFQRKLMEQYGI